MTLNTIRFFAILALALLVFATLSPIGLRPQSALPVDIERAAAYGVLGCLLGLAYPKHLLLTALGLCVLIFGLEMAQNFLPDRHSQEMDAAIKTVGGFVGLGLGWLISSFHLSRKSGKLP